MEPKFIIRRNYEQYTLTFHYTIFLNIQNIYSTINLTNLATTNASPYIHHISSEGRYILISLIFDTKSLYT